MVAPEVFWYSGLASGVVAGDYPPELDRIDGERLATAAGVSCLRTTATAIDSASKVVTTANGRQVGYDVCSLNVGSTSDPSLLAGQHPRLYRVKPVRLLFELCADLDIKVSAGEAPSVVVIGAGVTGTELACCFRHRLSRNGGRGRVSLVGRGGVTPELPGRARRSLERGLARMKVRFNQAGVDRLEEGRVVLDDGTELPADAVVLATGPRAPRFLRSSGLKCHDGDDAVIVDRHL